MCVTAKLLLRTGTSNVRASGAIGASPRIFGELHGLCRVKINYVSLFLVLIQNFSNGLKNLKYGVRFTHKYSIAHITFRYWSVFGRRSIERDRQRSHRGLECPETKR